MMRHTWTWRLLRRLVRADLPADRVTDAEVEAQRDRDYRWNFTVNLLDGAAFWFGTSFASASTILPLFISKLSDATWPLAAIAVLGQGGWYLPQLFTASSVERLSRKKPVAVNLGFFAERLPMWLLIVAAIVARETAGLALALLILAYAWHSIGAGVIATAWQDLIARCFPVEKRGRFLGLTTFIGTGMGAAGAALSSWLLATFPFPTSFVYTFTIAAVGVTLSWVFLALTREPVQPPEPLSKDGFNFWTDLRRIMGQDHNFRRFLVARLLIAFAGMGQGFLTVAALRRFGVADAVVGQYTGVMLLGQTAGTLILGFLADRYGHLLSLKIGAVSGTLAYLLAWLAPEAAWYYGVFALLGFAYGSMMVSGILVVLEFSPPARRPTYTGLANSIVGVAGFTAPLLGGVLARIGLGGGMGYRLLFALSAAAGLSGLVLLAVWVKEPRWEGNGHWKMDGRQSRDAG
ncbi:MAG: MFS transporter [Chloroflexi bacterium]|jgi:MFS family permease|nr:MFS transporter [Chloroflexota bacterium]